MINPELVEYIKIMRARGESDEAIKKSLTGAGWAIFDVETAFVSITSQAAPTPQQPAIQPVREVFEERPQPVSSQPSVQPSAQSNAQPAPQSAWAPSQSTPQTASKMFPQDTPNDAVRVDPIRAAMASDQLTKAEPVQSYSSQMYPPMEPVGGVKQFRKLEENLEPIPAFKGGFVKEPIRSSGSKMGTFLTIIMTLLVVAAAFAVYKYFLPNLFQIPSSPSSEGSVQ
ncbi:MAG: hypothetical protein V4526_01330 [Patescibacteria group bacterium]